MQLLTGVVSLCISSLIVTNHAIPLQQPGTAVASSTESPLLDTSDDEGLLDSDFDDDDDPDSLLDLVDANERGMDSLIHLHEKGGEILVPCFGMWWPVGGGGGGPVYDYVEDYGDYKKRRRSRKKKKAAKMKRKKS